MQHLIQMTKYKAWANQQFFEALLQLPEQELIAERSIIFGNILRTCHHVFAMDCVWKAHLLGEQHGFKSRNPDHCPPLVELISSQRQIDNWFISYANELTPATSQQVVHFEFIDGGNGAMSREAIMLHLVNHATYHRGHIASMMYDCSVKPPTTDLTVYLTKQHQ